MNDPKNDYKWLKFRIKNRIEKKEIPYYGTIEQMKYQKKEQQKKL